MLSGQDELGRVEVDRISPLIAIFHNDTFVGVCFAIEQLLVTSELLEAYDVPEQVSRLFISLEELCAEKRGPMLPRQVLVFHLLKGRDPLAITIIESELLGQHVPRQDANVFDRLIALSFLGRGCLDPLSGHEFADHAACASVGRTVT